MDNSLILAHLFRSKLCLNKIKTVHDLGVTGIDNGLNGVTYKKNKNGSYDVNATIISLVNPKLDPKIGFNVLLMQTGLQEEVQAHEESHGDQFDEALKGNYTVNALTLTDKNGKKSTISFSGTINPTTILHSNDSVLQAIG